MLLSRTHGVMCDLGTALQSRGKCSRPSQSAFTGPNSAVQRFSKPRRIRSCCSASLREDLEEIQQEIQDQEDVMDACVKREDFSGAATARDSVTSMQLQRRAVELKMQADATTIHLKVGQVIRHQKFDYKGVIVGYDPQCTAPDSWINKMGVDKLPFGRHQPFYHVLCDERDRPSSWAGPTTTYVAQENCNLLPLKVASPVENGLIEYNFEGFHNGRYVPKEHLREQYPDTDVVATSDNTPGSSGLYDTI